jgi:hypothetical protein
MESSALKRQHEIRYWVLCGDNVELLASGPKSKALFRATPSTSTVGKYVVAGANRAAGPLKGKAVLQRGNLTSNGESPINSSVTMMKQELAWFRICEAPDIMTIPVHCPQTNTDEVGQQFQVRNVPTRERWRECTFEPMVRYEVKSTKAWTPTQSTV